MANDPVAAADPRLDRYVARALLLNERYLLGEFGADSLAGLTADLRTEFGLTELEIDVYVKSRQRSLVEWDAFLQDINSNIK